MLGNHSIFINMVTVTIKYNNTNTVLNGILEAVAQMPDVEIIRTLVPSKARTVVDSMNTEEFSRLSLSEQAKVLNQSINLDAPKMTMEEIVQEVRDYRDGK